MAAPITTCYRHGDRRAGVSCQRCERPICANCMVQASVGFQCPECVKGGQQQVVNSRNLHTLNRPYVTYVLIAINVAVFGLAELLVQTKTADLRVEGGVVALGTLHSGQEVGVAAGEWYRIFTSGFLHLNILHVGMNMLVLYMIGTQLERAIGHGKFLGLYVTSLIAGSLAALAFNPHVLTMGASGAIYGLFGVIFIHQRSIGIDPWRSGIGGLIIFNLLFSFAIPGISIAGHLGGLVGGALAALAVFAVERRIKSQWASVGVCAGLSVLLFAAAIVVAQNPVVA
ncbi:MAG: rhomboid family intramembrane serine protease [Actinobacteria bacterium]|nr:rhomboid family intramembrane serine protease [Actinomycetota bacterium]